MIFARPAIAIGSMGLAAALVSCAPGRAVPLPSSPAAAAYSGNAEGSERPVAEVEPLFEVAVGAAPAPLASSEQNEFLLPSGGGPSSIDVDDQGRWWVLDPIASRMVVFERDGKVHRTISLPESKTSGASSGPRRGRKDKSPQTEYRPDLALTGTNGIFVLNASSKRVEHYDLEGRPTGRGFGSDSVPRRKGEPALLELPGRLSMFGGDLFVADDGSETLLRFGTDGAFLGAVPGSDAAPASGGSVYLLAVDDEGTTWIESWPSVGPLGLPTNKRIARVMPSHGKVAHRIALLGATPEGEAVVALVEGTEEEAQRVRVIRFDSDGKRPGERILPAPRDDANPVRRWRVTRDGHVAWFRIHEGRFQAFDLEL